MGIPHRTTTRPHMPSLTVEQPAPPPFVARLYTPQSRRTTRVEPLDETQTRRRKTDKASRRQKFAAAAQARRRWLVASIRIKAVTRFSSPAPNLWAGQKLKAVMRFRRYGRNSVCHISNGSFQRFLGLPTTEESPSLTSTPREPPESKPPAQANRGCEVPWSRRPVLPPVRSPRPRTTSPRAPSSYVVCGTICAARPFRSRASLTSIRCTRFNLG